MALRRNRSLARALPLRVQGVVITGLVLLIVILAVSERMRMPWVTDLRGTLLDVSSPAVRVFSPILSWRAGATVSDIREVPRLWAVNESLREENARLSGWFVEATRLESENRALRALLRLPQADAPKAVAGRVLGDTGGIFARSVLVSSGQNAGVEVGFVAANSSGLVGRVVEVGQHSARVLLLSDINSRLPVYVSGTRHEAILAGDNSETPQLLYPQEPKKIRGGQVVFTSGQGGAFAPMQKVGVVEDAGQNGWRVRLFAKPHQDLFLLLVPPSLAGTLEPSESAAFATAVE